MITFENVLDEYLKIAKLRLCGDTLIIPLMLIVELRKVNDHLGYISFKGREYYNE